MKQFFVTFLMALLVAGVVPSVALARDEMTTEQAYLLARIAELQIELQRLQALLTERKREPAAYVPYQVVLFTEPIEATYLVENHHLKPETGKGIRTGDLELFSLFKETLGETAVTKYVKEWRIYNDVEGDTDAYVEQIVGTDTYVVNVNRAGFDTANASDQEALRKLFVHEYAHMLLLSYPNVMREYEDTFWTANDRRVSRFSYSQKEKYLIGNQDRFVSEYALNSADEDMAEVFLYAIVDPTTVMYGERREKYDFLSDLPRVKEEIIRLREHLK